ncbi:MAG: hypothetical protein Q9194_005679 [Teloschistes cf. exilis]
MIFLRVMVLNAVSHIALSVYGWLMYGVSTAKPDGNDEHESRPDSTATAPMKDGQEQIIQKWLVPVATEIPSQSREKQPDQKGDSLKTRPAPLPTHPFPSNTVTMNSSPTAYNMLLIPN